MEKTESKRAGKVPSRGGRTNRRSQILAATEKLIRTKGLSGVTTRQIAEVVGCSEGALYVHFKGRLELLLAVLEESLPNMVDPLRALKTAVGKETPQRNLEAAARGIFSFQQRIIPILGSLFGEPDLLAGYRKSLEKAQKGPHLAVATLAEYVRAEQSLGRVHNRVDPRMAGTLLMSATFFRAFGERFFGKPGELPLGEFLKEMVASLVPGP
jgi:AcrR family transcriptional regulator